MGKSQINFGDYVSVEMKRFGCDDEFYIHKVIEKLNSHKYIVWNYYPDCKQRSTDELPFETHYKELK